MQRETRVATLLPMPSTVILKAFPDLNAVGVRVIKSDGCCLRAMVKTENPIEDFATFNGGLEDAMENNLLWGIAVDDTSDLEELPSPM